MKKDATTKNRATPEGLREQLNTEKQKLCEMVMREIDAGKTRFVTAQILRQSRLVDRLLEQYGQLAPPTNRED